MTVPLTDDDFNVVSWHDCHVRGVSIDAGDSDTGDWTSDLDRIERKRVV